MLGTSRLNPSAASKCKETVVELSEKRHGDGVIVLAPAGRIGHDNADAFRETLQPHLACCAAGQCRIVLDFSKVEYVSSAGLRILMLAARQVGAQSGAFAIAALQPLVREIFEIARFDMVFRTFDTVDDAVAGVRKAATRSPD